MRQETDATGGGYEQRSRTEPFEDEEIKRGTFHEEGRLTE